jgi:putative hydrolase of the HAD superfamily
MEIKTLIFDFGNVVGFFDHRRTTQRLLPHADRPANELHALLFDGSLEDDYEAGNITTAEFIRRLLDTCCLRCDEATVAAAWADIFTLNPDIAALLPRLKPDFRLLLASNTNELHARHYCRQFADTLRHFDALVFSHEIGARKPGAAFYAHCQRLAGCEPEGCLFIDDLPANIEGARAWGWHGIIYTGIDDLHSQLARYGIDWARKPRV